MFYARAPSRGMGGWRGPPPTTYKSITDASNVRCSSCLVQTYGRRHILGTNHNKQNQSHLSKGPMPAPKSVEIYIWASHKDYCELWCIPDPPGMKLPRKLKWHIAIGILRNDSTSTNSRGFHTGGAA